MSEVGALVGVSQARDVGDGQVEVRGTSNVGGRARRRRRGWKQRASFVSPAFHHCSLR